MLNQNICLAMSLEFVYRSGVCFCNSGVISSFCDSKDNLEIGLNDDE